MAILTVQNQARLRNDKYDKRRQQETSAKHMIHSALETPAMSWHRGHRQLLPETQNIIHDQLQPLTCNKLKLTSTDTAKMTMFTDHSQH